MPETITQVGQTTIRYPYEVLRAISATDDAALDADTMQLGLPSGVRTKSNRAEIIIHGTNLEDEAGTWELYAQAQDGPAELMGVGTVALGDILTGIETLDFYANNIVITTQKWLGVINAVAADDTSLYIAKLEFDCFGYDRIWLALTKTTAATLGAKVRWV